MSWYQVPKGAHVSTAKPVLVASGKATFAHAGTKKITLKLTTKGKKLLIHSRRVALTAKATFTPAGKATVTAIQTFTLRR